MTYGIDFGTSNSVVSIYDNGIPRILPLGDEGEVVPSLMYLDSEGKRSIGHAARDDYAKALGLGTDRRITFRFFQALKFALRDPFFAGTKLFGKYWTIEQLVGAFLREIRVLADRVTGGAGDAVVLGRPVSLSGNPADDAVLMARYREACRLAGFRDARFVLEPVAALSGLPSSGDGITLVFDFGGGTLDITVAESRGGSANVLANAGMDLGGYLLNEDISRARIIPHFGYGSTFRTMTGKNLEIPRWITNQVASFYALPLADIQHIRKVVKDLLSEAKDRRKLEGLLDFMDRNLNYRLFERIDDAKIALSSSDSAKIALDVLPHVSFKETIALAEFESIIGPRVDRARDLVGEALDRAGIPVGRVDRVVRVGGSSRVPAFVRMLESFFPGKVSEGDVFTSISYGLLEADRAGLTVS